MNTLSRADRKLDHIRHALGHERELYSHFDEMDIVHQSLARLDFNRLQLDTQMGELTLSSPLFVNAMTGGGGNKTAEINRDLALAAKQTGISMAVGSQMSALKNEQERHTYEVVREANPDGVIFANVGSEATADQAHEAVSMLNANALQVHVNTLQELIMPEGDRNFTKRLHRIEQIISNSTVPVIIKEVGYGLSRESVSTLIDLGVSYVDVGGRGGTNFSMVENNRREKPFQSYNDWGIPTLASIMEIKQAYPDLYVIGSGGIRHGLDGVKAMVAGACAFGMAGNLLRVLMEEGLEALVEEIHHIHNEIKMAMMLLNVEETEAFYKQPHVLYGRLKDWREQRLTR